MVHWVIVAPIIAAGSSCRSLLAAYRAYRKGTADLDHIIDECTTAGLYVGVALGTIGNPWLAGLTAVIYAHGEISDILKERKRLKAPPADPPQSLNP